MQAVSEGEEDVWEGKEEQFGPCVEPWKQQEQNRPSHMRRKEEMLRIGLDVNKANRPSVKREQKGGGQAKLASQWATGLVQKTGPT